MGSQRVRHDWATKHKRVVTRYENLLLKQALPSLLSVKVEVFFKDTRINTILL